jgi:DNA-binding winged helix-turn-helix (wHTH) protein/tetratricopeptide (TPR) repeat protein
MPASVSQQGKELYEFGPFRVDPEKETLLRAGVRVPLTPKAFQILLVLVRHCNQVVSKDDLMKAVWPDTFVEETNLTRNIFMLRKALGESPPEHRYIVTVPGRGYRLAESVHLVPEHEASIVADDRSREHVEVKETKPRGQPWVQSRVWFAVAVIVLFVGAAVAIRFWLHRSPVLSETDTLVLADFVNSTGDPVFDQTLRQGLAVQLEQSPYLSLVSDERIQQTLRMMGQPPDARPTPERAREICQRIGSAAVLVDGSIARLGSQYVLGLKAVDCHNGNTLAEQQATAGGKEQVLGALGGAARKLRSMLGESLKTVQKFDTPIEQATTPSLEALQAYSLGVNAFVARNDPPAAISLVQRAIDLDSNFASAYAFRALSYWNLGENSLAAEDARKAYELRDRVSQHEKFLIESSYYSLVTGDLERARQVYELWGQTYPRDAGAPGLESGVYFHLGQYDKALEKTRKAVQLEPTAGVVWAGVANAYLALNQFDEARATVQEAQAKNLDSPQLHFDLYALAFLEGDATGMAQQVTWSAGKPGVEDVFLVNQADTEAYFGRLGKARVLSRRAVASAKQAGEKEAAANYEADAAVREALFGNTAAAQERAEPALGLSSGRDVQYGAALALALGGEYRVRTRVERLAHDWLPRFPEDTIAQFNYLPTIRAQLALNRNNPSEAIEDLQGAAPYELGLNPPGVLYIPYARGQAYLAMHQGSEAATEFQKILDHRGAVINEPIGALAHLGLGRAYALEAAAQRDQSPSLRGKALTAYRHFLTLWKDADPDVPVLKEARTEYAKLQ